MLCTAVEVSDQDGPQDPDGYLENRSAKSSTVLSSVSAWLARDVILVPSEVGWPVLQVYFRGWLCVWIRLPVRVGFWEEEADDLACLG